MTDVNALGISWLCMHRVGDYSYIALVNCSACLTCMFTGSVLQVSTVPPVVSKEACWHPKDRIVSIYNEWSGETLLVRYPCQLYTEVHQSYTCMCTVRMPYTPWYSMHLYTAYHMLTNNSHHAEVYDIRKLKCPLEKEADFLLCAVCTTAVNLIWGRNSLVYLIYKLDDIFQLQICSHMHYAEGLECGGSGRCHCTLMKCMYICNMYIMVMWCILRTYEPKNRGQRK